MTTDHWKDCIGGLGGGGGYYHDTYLRRRSTGGYAHLDRVYLSNPLDEPTTIWQHFGSSLRQL